MVERIKNEPELRKNFESVRGKPYVDNCWPTTPGA